MVKRVILVAVLGLVPTAVTSTVAEATSPVLTVPAKVQLVQGQPPPPVPATLSFVGLLGACGGTVAFTWDGRAWASAQPAGTGLTSCEASVSPPAPATTPAGAHQVCATSDVASACGSLTVAIQAAAPPSRQPRPAAPAAPAPSPSPSPTPSAAPSPSPSPTPRSMAPPAEEPPAGALPAPAVDPKHRASVGPVSPTGVLIALAVLLAALAGMVLSLRSLFGGDQTMRRRAQK